MASIILTSAASSVASSANSFLGLNSIPIFGSKIAGRLRSFTSGIAKTVGAEVDGFLFGETEENRIRGSRLNDLSVQTSTYGETIPLVFGRTRMAGNVIWSQDIKEIPVTTSSSTAGGKGGGGFGTTKKTTTSFNYTATFAVAICEGEIDTLDRVWANSTLINISDYCTSYEIHKGSNTQTCSAIIESFEGVDNTPAYKELAYIVFEDFDISSFGNRIPNLTFEVNKQHAASFDSESEKVEDLVKSINLIPGSGEFVYDTKIQTKINGYDLAGKWIQTGPKETINANNANNQADVKVSLTEMQKTFPNLEWVSIICTWFADSLDISTATIKPKVEYKTGTITEPDQWSVAGIARSAADEITKDGNGRPIYGGTPSDSSILNLITELQSMGYKIMFYPMIFMDMETKPWRGNMTGNASDVSDFFSRTSGYNDFINHYADLVKDKVDAFIIGSEMKALTSIQDVDDSFPAVDEFVSLATTVKTTMGASTKISYAADWSEYHSTNGWFNMDPLWASSDIDFVGIDAYFPLTDEPQNGVYDLQKVIDGWTGGEGYDWYYSDAERTTKVTYPDGEHAWKNITYWWNNTHTNPDESGTSWTAGMKKIWFTEYGFPSVDGATNQPNVFFNPDSVDGGLPYHSKGYVDILAQKLGIEATLRKWKSSAMIENKFLWAWDARPYPFWPDLSSIWSDGSVWSKGHWVQGKLGISNLSSVIKTICERSGIDENDLDLAEVSDVIEGYIVKNRSSGEKALSFVTEPNFIYMQENGIGINFLSKGNAQNIKVGYDELILDEKGRSIKITSLGEQNLPEKIDLNYIDGKAGYLLGSQSAERDSKSGIKKEEFNLPVVMPKSKAKRIAERHLLDEWVNSKIYEFKLDRSKIYIEAGDNLELTDESDNTIYNLYVANVEIDRDGNLELTAINYEKSIYDDYYDDLLDADAKTEALKSVSETGFEILNLPLLSDDDEAKINIYAAASPLADKWSGCAIYMSYNGEEGDYEKVSDIEASATLGYTIEDLDSGSPYITDENSTFRVALISGELESKTEEEFLIQKSNYATIGDEIIKFQNATLVDDNTYEISGIVRGRFGTENKIDSHTAGTRFVLLDEKLTKISLPLNYLSQDLSFKAVSYGSLTDNAETKTVTITGQNLKPYSVVNAVAVQDGSNDITINFDRRSRVFSGWNVPNPPLAEQQEKYEIDVINSNEEIVRTIETSSSLAIYTEAQQVEDFSSEISDIKANIYQISDLVGRGDAYLLEESW